MPGLVIRILIGLATIIATLIVLALVNPDGHSETQICTDDKTKEHMRGMALEAIDKGFRDHVSLLFSIWVKDQQDQPKRAKVGMQDDIRAYIRARKDVLAWLPPNC